VLRAISSDHVIRPALHSDREASSVKKLRISSVPRPLYDAMVKEAKDNNRPISEEIVAALQRRRPTETWRRRFNTQSIIPLKPKTGDSGR
jgi:hypothetical protein